MASIRLPVRLPTFDSRLVDDLVLLQKLPADKLQPIAECAVRLIVSKAGEVDTVAQLAGSLQSRPDKIRPIVQGLSSAFWECAKARVPSDVFVQAISQLSLGPESNVVLQQVYAEHYANIVATTTAFSMGLPEYRHLDWRIDMEIGRRTLALDATPKFMLRLDVAEGASDKLRCVGPHGPVAGCAKGREGMQECKRPLDVVCPLSCAWRVVRVTTCMSDWYSSGQCTFSQTTPT